MGWGQSKVSKLEHQADDEFTIGDLNKYFDAVGMQITLGFTGSKTTWFDMVQYHYFRMKDFLDKISGSAKGDEKIQQGVNNVMGEATLNLLQLAQRCLGNVKMPAEKMGLIISDPIFDTADSESAQYAEQAPKKG